MFRPTTIAPGARHLLSTRRLASTKPSPSKPRRSGAPPPSNGARRQTLRRMILTGGVALVTAVGAITGARLKADHDAGREWRQQQQQRQRDAAYEAPPLDDRIAGLEARRAGLEAMKVPLERKLAALRERIDGREEAGERRGGRI